MRIAINARLLLPHKLDGIGRFTYETVTRLFQSHPDTTFHLLFDRTPPREFQGISNVVCHRVWPPARRPWLFRIWLEWSIPRLLRSIGADVFLSPDGLGSLHCPCPQLVVIHDINFFHYPHDLPGTYSNYLNTITRQLVPVATRLATVSSFSRSELASAYGLDAGSVDIIPNAIAQGFAVLHSAEVQAVRDELTAGAPYFLFLGSLHPRKNVPRLLEAFDQFLSEHSTDHRLVIAGEVFWMGGEITAALRRMRHRDRVVLVGRVEGHGTAKVMGAACGLTFMSYYEGFGIPVLEAFACGVPVLTSRGTAMEEVAAGAALLADPFDPSDIARGMAALAFDEGLRDRLIRSGLERAGAFSWDHSADLLWQSILRTRT
ncbi:MAG: glycosyltransferase family 4 protein [Flavobacteriales bacterium]